jgi:Asp/Glu/hydantoin racemase
LSIGKKEIMKLIVIPPYRAQNYTPEKGHFMVREVIEEMRDEGQLEGIEIDIDPGHPVENTLDDEGKPEPHVSSYRAYDELGAGTLKRVTMFGDGTTYDGIVTSGGIDPGFAVSRLVSKVPLTAAVHSAAHFASAIGNRFSVIHLDDPTAMIVRRSVQEYGLGHKLVSVRSMGHSSPSTMTVLRSTARGERAQTPEGKQFIDDIVDQCIVAIDEDRADCLVFGTPAIQCLHGEVKLRLDDAGYGEIPIIRGLRSAIEMAKAMVNMNLIQAPRAYPSDALKARPRFR